MIKDLALADIRIDGGTQNRDIDDDVILRYKALIEDGTEFPPISVIFDGKDNFLYDGFHRLHCHRKLKRNYIQANVVEGTKRDAIFRSFGANAKHGSPRPKGTAKKIIEKILADKEWCSASHEEIAMAVGVSKRHVRAVVADLSKKKKGNKSGQKSTDKRNCSAPSEPQNEDSIENAPKADTKVLDSTGKEVPEHLKEIFGRKSEITEYVAQMNKMFRDIKDAVEKNDPLYANCKLEALKADVGNVRRNLRFTLPYAVCRYCGGDVNNKECRACNARGWVNELSYKATPTEMK